MKTSSSKMTRITISVDPDDYEAFEALAEKEDRSAAWMIRKAMRQFLGKEQIQGYGNEIT